MTYFPWEITDYYMEPPAKKIRERMIFVCSRPECKDVSWIGCVDEPSPCFVCGTPPKLRKEN